MTDDTSRSFASESVSNLSAWLSVVILSGIITWYVPMLYTGTVPGALEKQVPMGYGHVLAGVSESMIKDFWPLRLCVAFAFSMSARCLVAISTLVVLLGSMFATAPIRRLVASIACLAMSAWLIVNMFAIFHVFGSG